MHKTVSKKFPNKVWWKWSVSEWDQNVSSYCHDVKKNALEILDNVDSVDPDTALDFAGKIFMSHSGEPFDSFYYICELATLVSTDKDIKDISSRSQVFLKELATEVSSDERWASGIESWAKRTSNTSSHRIAELLQTKLKLRGSGLDKKTKKHFLKISSEIKKLGKDFDNEIQTYEKFILCDADDLAGLSEAFISGLQKVGVKYKVTTASHHMGQFVTYTPNMVKARELVVLGAQKGGKKNLERLEKMVKLRKELAEILGYDSFAKMNISVRSEKDPQVLLSLAKKLSKELTPMYEFDTKLYRDIGLIPKSEQIPMWQTGRLGNKITKEVLKLPDGQTLKNYFQFKKVLPILLSNLAELLSLTVVEKQGKYWDKGVVCYSLLDSKSGEYFGDIYFDMLYRPNKNEHPCCCAYSESSSNIFIPVMPKSIPRSSVVIMSLAQPTKKVPTLIGLGSIETLWHELGHAVHNVLGSSQASSIAGFNTPWDTVEIPSQLFEHFFWSVDTIHEYSEHYQTGEKLDKKIIKKIIASNDALVGVGYRYQLLTYTYDLLLHNEELKDDVRGFYRELYPKMLPDYGLLEESMFPASLGHIAHGYEAGYYTYMWTNLIAYDIAGFLKSGESGWSKKKLKDFRKQVLEIGNSADVIESIENFLGRSINPESMIERFKKSYKVISDIVAKSK